jgi:dihydrolipoamide dehydrogenase
MKSFKKPPHYHNFLLKFDLIITHCSEINDEESSDRRKMMEKSLLIIGGGPGGYVAAIRAAQLGIEVALVEGDRLGGTCLNRGCIPTKALYANAQLMDKLAHASDFGVDIDGYRMDMGRVMDRKLSVVDQLVKGIDKLVEENAITLFRGFAKFTGAHEVEISLADGGKETVSAKNIIIATGSVPSSPPVPGSDLPGVIDSDALLEMRELPKRMVVAGSGVIGMEFASIYNSFGTEVTVISSTLLKRIDKDIVKRLPGILKKRGLKLHDGARAQEIRKTDQGLLMVATNKKGETIEVEADVVLMAVGRRAYFDGLDMEAAGVEHSGKGIPVDDCFRTNVPHIYAIGDVLGGVMLAHVASHQGIACVEGIVSGEKPKHGATVPDCIFIDPQIAYAGLTEEQAIEKGYEVKIGKFNFVANGKALAMGETEGFVKVVADAGSLKILGVHIMGPHASDLIHEASLAIDQNMDVHVIGQAIHAHPTLAEAFHEAVLNVTETSIHIAPPRKKK